MDRSLLIVQTSVGSLADAERLARTLVTQRVAACVQMTPMQSVFWWEGEVQAEAEIRLDIKTAPARKEALLALLSRAHPYDVPEIVIHDDVGASEDYARWAVNETISGPDG